METSQPQDAPDREALYAAAVAEFGDALMRLANFYFLVISLIQVMAPSFSFLFFLLFLYILLLRIFNRCACLWAV